MRSLETKDRVELSLSARPCPLPTGRGSGACRGYRSPEHAENLLSDVSNAHNVRPVRVHACGQRQFKMREFRRRPDGPLAERVPVPGGGANPASNPARDGPPRPGVPGVGPRGADFGRFHGYRPWKTAAPEQRTRRTAAKRCRQPVRVAPTRFERIQKGSINAAITMHGARALPHSRYCARVVDGARESLRPPIGVGGELFLRFKRA